MWPNQIFVKNECAIFFRGQNNPKFVGLNTSVIFEKTATPKKHWPQSENSSDLATLLTRSHLIQDVIYTLHAKPPGVSKGDQLIPVNKAVNEKE
jgi:hypothetical protein